MAEKVTLKVLRCPTCGADLKAKNNVDAITCVYCGNTIVPVQKTSEAPQGAAGFGSTVKVDGIKTSSSARAYMELFFEEYDWEGFTYAQSFSISEIDKLLESLKVTSADDKNTWIACFKALAVPFAHKVSGCRKILASVIEEYQKDSLDAYSKFDAYKRIAAMVASCKQEVAAKLETYAAAAGKYGATKEELDELYAGLDSVKAVTVVTYDDIEEVPQIKAFNEEKNAKIVAQLAAEGIDAQSEYARAKELIRNENYVEALNVLLSLEGYLDADELADKLDKYFLLSDVLEIEGKLYYFKKSESGQNALALYPTEDGKIAGEAIIKNIGRIITNYADILYYLDSEDVLSQYDFASKKETKLMNSPVLNKRIFVYDRKVFLLARKQDQWGESSTKRDVIQLDLATGAVKAILGNVKDILSLNGNKMIYTIAKKVGEEEYTYATLTNIVNVDTMDVVALGTKKVSVEGFVDNSVIYSQEAPNGFNKNLYIKEMGVDKPEQLIEQNIFNFCDIVADRLFYYVGNSRNQVLISINLDGTDRREFPLYISEFLFVQGGWLYFTRKSGYNAILCKSRLDGSKFSVIAADIDRFLNIKNGYLYYINDEATLVKVRMDGSNLQELCEDVEEVLAIREDKIIFISVDDRATVGVAEQGVTKTVKSIYAVDFSGSGMIKLAYNVRSAKEYDEDTIYYIAAQTIKSSDAKTDGQLELLYKLDVKTNGVKKLLKLEMVEKEDTGLSKFAIAMIVMAVALFFTMIGFAAEATGLGILGLLTSIGALIVGLMFKYGTLNE